MKLDTEATARHPEEGRRYDLILSASGDQQSGRRRAPNGQCLPRSRLAGYGCVQRFQADAGEVIDLERSAGALTEHAAAPGVGLTSVNAADPGAGLRLQILTTEHWSLLATRSLTWNESRRSPVPS